jgi:hypothetical protein
MGWFVVPVRDLWRGLFARLIAPHVTASPHVSHQDARVLDGGASHAAR